MPRKHVWLPQELLAAVEERGHVNYSAVLQEGLRGLIGCEHDALACQACAAPIDRHQLVDEGLARFYRAAVWALEDLVYRVGTAEGACRVLREVARAHKVPGVENIPLPRPSRSRLEAARATSSARVQRRAVPDD